MLSAGLIYEFSRAALNEPNKFGVYGWKAVFAALIVGSALLALKSEQRLLSWWAATATAAIVMLLALLPAIQNGLPGAGSFTEVNSYMQLQTLLYEALPGSALSSSCWSSSYGRKQACGPG